MTPNNVRSILLLVRRASHFQSSVGMAGIASDKRMCQPPIQLSRYHDNIGRTDTSLEEIAAVLGAHLARALYGTSENLSHRLHLGVWEVCHAIAHAYAI